jgi:hypothetical protein
MGDDYEDVDVATVFAPGIDLALWFGILLAAVVVAGCVGLALAVG